MIKGAKATKVLFPDDPSNVHHSYLNDHVKMRVVHAGPKEHHIHHLHAHQWLNTPDSDNSSYLDSQAMGPGYSFTTEIAHGGSGNRNKTPGDSIFHCHFYRTSRKACGKCGARTTFSKKARSSTAMAVLRRCTCT